MFASPDAIARQKAGFSPGVAPDIYTGQSMGGFGRPPSPLQTGGTIAGLQQPPDIPGIGAQGPMKPGFENYQPRNPDTPYMPQITPTPGFDDFYNQRKAAGGSFTDIMDAWGRQQSGAPQSPMQPAMGQPYSPAAASPMQTGGTLSQLGSSGYRPQQQGQQGVPWMGGGGPASSYRGGA